MNKVEVNKKQELRKQILQRRTKLNSSYQKIANEKIIQNIIDSYEYQKSSTIFTFIGKKGEIDTRKLIIDAVKRGKVVGVPRVYPGNVMKVHRFKSFEELTMSKLHILEPAATNPLIEISSIDLTILPCVTCNLKGDRLGYGGGYYDRFLSTAGEHSLSYLPCLAQLQVDKIPLAENDVQADVVVTENGLFKDGKIFS